MPQLHPTRGLSRYIILQSALTLLQEQEGRLTGQSQRIGARSAPQRMLGLQAARMAQQVGVGNLPPSLREAARGFAPEFIRNAEERFGQTTPEYKAGVGAGLLEDGNLQQIREEIGKVDTNVRMQVVLDEAGVARQILEGLQPALKELVRSLREETQAEVERQKRGLQMRNAAQ